MNPKKITKEVMSNSKKSDKEIVKILKTKKHKDEYIIYNAGKKCFADTFEKAVSLGIKKYGDDTGFSVKKITEQIPILSSLIKI